MSLAESEIAAKADSTWASESTSFAAVPLCRPATLTSGSGDAAASTSAPPAVVYSFQSMRQELLGVACPPADVVNLGKWQENVEQNGLVFEWCHENFRENYVQQKDFKELDSHRDMSLLAAKLHSSPNVTFLNLSGNDLRDSFTNGRSMMLDVTQALGKLTALQDINLVDCQIADKYSGLLVESLGKLTALTKVNLSGAV